MPKTSKPTISSSPFDELIKARSRTSSQPDVQEPRSSLPEPPAIKLAKSVDPSYTKFTSYIRKQTHKAVKMRLVGESREMSDLVEELLSEWLIRGSNPTE